MRSYHAYSIANPTIRAPGVETAEKNSTPILKPENQNTMTTFPRSPKSPVKGRPQADASPDPGRTWPNVLVDEVHFPHAFEISSVFVTASKLSPRSSLSRNSGPAPQISSSDVSFDSHAALNLPRKRPRWASMDRAAPALAPCRRHQAAS